ncbi:MAG TPA: hypothetical protein VL738_15825 [Dactylosporangium sp.]|nr:hypothetical protein [Dactylosporangium sp.]
MPATVTLALTRRRPMAAWATIGVLGFLGVSAVAGRVALIDTWVVPGLVPGIGFGPGSLLAAYGVLRRPPVRTGTTKGVHRVHDNDPYPDR